MADKENDPLSGHNKVADQSAPVNNEALNSAERNSAMSVDDTAGSFSEPQTPSDNKPSLSSQVCVQNDSMINSNNVDCSGMVSEHETKSSDHPEVDMTTNLSDTELRPDINNFGSALKKDDSGIVLLKSPAGERSGDDNNDRAQDGETATGNVNRPSTSNESEGVVADFVDTEEGDVATISTEDAEVMKAGSVIDTGDENSENDDDEDDDGSDDRSVFRRQLQNVVRSVLVVRPGRVSVITKRHLPLDNDNDDDDDEDDDNGQGTGADESMRQEQTTKDSSSDDGDSEMDVDIDQPPSDSWKPLFELNRQQIGYSNRIPAAKIFRDKCGASVNLVQRLKQYCKLEHHEGCVNALHFNEQGTLLASGSDDLDIIVWKWLEKKPFFVFESGHRSNVFQSKFMPYTGDTHIVSCARDGQVRLAELSSTGTCKGTKRLAQHKGAAHKLALLQDSSHLFYSCGEDAVTYEIDLRQKKPNKLSTTKENNRKVQLYSIHSNPFKSFEYCVSGRDHYIRVFDIRMANEGENSGLIKKYSPHHLQNASDNDLKANVTCAVYNYNGQEILGTYNDEHIYLFDNTHSDGADAIHTYKGHRNNATVKGVNFYGPKSEFIITGSDCGNIFLWEKESEKIVNYFQGDDAGVVNVLEPHPQSPIIATSGLDHEVKIWMPLAQEPTKLEGLKRVVKRNKKERDEDRLDPTDAIDGTTFWRLMRHFRRTTQARFGEETSTDSNNSDNSDDDDNDSDHESAIQCVPS